MTCKYAPYKPSPQPHTKTTTDFQEKHIKTWMPTICKVMASTEIVNIREDHGHGTSHYRDASVEWSSSVPNIDRYDQTTSKMSLLRLVPLFQTNTANFAYPQAHIARMDPLKQRNAAPASDSM